VRFAVRTDDLEVGRHTFVHGAYDHPVMVAAMRCLAAAREVPVEAALAERCVVDAGANVGTSIVPLIRLFGAADGVAIEPAPANVDMLRLTLALNDLTDRVDVVPAAVSDRPGHASLALSRDNSGDHRLLVDGSGSPESSADSVDVAVTSIDELVARGSIAPDRVGLLWIDVQGLEGHVLAGSTALLDLGVPIVTECWPTLLRGVGGLERFERAIAGRYRTVIDLRATDERGEPGATSIDAVLDRYAAPDAFTDLLLVP
jgi:FkbM family methyltransferase